MSGPCPDAGADAGARRAEDVVIAVGNRFRRDDGVGAAVLDALRSRRADGHPVLGGVDLVELDGEATRLVDAWQGRSLAILVDAMRHAELRAGEVVELHGPEGLARPGTAVSSHSTGVAEAARLGRVLGRLPDRVVVLGVVCADLGEGPGLSDAVAAAVPEVAARVEGILAEVRSSGRVPG